ncbi:MAG: dihydrouridine synthase DuS [Firmicutes bacterium]|nr:dihydrouridine synthase DuS [Bacillota bacterium]
MQLYFAPLEGITNSTYLDAHRRFFDPLNKYYTPFFIPNSQTGIPRTIRRELLLAREADFPLIPQVLTNQSGDFLSAAAAVKCIGCTELNLNLGCPSGTVVSKGRGAGFLTQRDTLTRFLDEIFSAPPLPISIKTRIGMENPEEFPPLLALFNQYPISQLTVHPRVRREFYRGSPNLDAFRIATEESRNPLVYSGDLFTPTQIAGFQQEFPRVEAVMLGRGLIANPALADMARGGSPLSRELLASFHDYLYGRYRELLFGPSPVLHKMKELWHYMICLFPDHQKALKRLRKAMTLPDYEAAVTAIFRDLPLDPHSGYYTH